MIRTICMVLTLVSTAIACQNKLISPENHENYVIGYVFVGDKLINAADIPANKFTHIYYAFANIENGKVVEGFSKDTENYSTLNELKKQNPGLKILASVGGWTWSGDFSDAALTKTSREVFAKSARQFLVKHQLDGIDVDWEYPNLSGDGNKHRPEDIKNFSLLMEELRNELDEQGTIDDRHYLTSAACGAFPDYIENTEMGEAQKYMDFVNVMTYDFYVNGADTITGHHSALYTNPKDPKKLSADAAIEYFIDAGVPAEKLVLGFPFYGRAWGNVDTTFNGLYQRGSKANIRSSHNAIVNTLLNDDSAYKRFWDDEAQVPYLFNKEDQVFITYDDMESVIKKCEYIKNKKLKGAMFWAFGSDYENTYLNALNLELRPEYSSKKELIDKDLGAGFRYSSYGARDKADDFNYWTNVGNAMSDNFPGSTPECVWIAGTLYERGARLSFPVDAEDPLIKGRETDIYEEALNTFDSLGFRVWLQIEPGYASVDELIHLMLKQYAHHTCVTGVGVDVEWYNSNDPDEGQAVTDEEAERWLNIAKSYNSDYRIFFKHWLIEKMPPTAREDIVFINDSQQLSSLDQMLKEFMDWGQAFYPSAVGFQYGYPSDKKWWSAYKNPPQLLGDYFLENIPNTRSLFWVDFGITEVFPPGQF